MFQVSTSSSIGHRRVVEVVLVQQDLVVEEPRRERVRLPVPRPEERVRKIGLARHHQQAPVEADRVAREPVPAVLDHQAAVAVRRDHREPAVLVVERARRGRVEVGKPGPCADLVEEHAVDRHLRLPARHELLDPLPHVRRVRRHDHAGVVAVGDRLGLSLRVERCDVLHAHACGEVAHRRRARVPPAEVRVRHDEVAGRVRGLDERVEVGVRAPLRIRRQEVRVARVVPAGLVADGVEEDGRRQRAEPLRELRERAEQRDDSS